MTKSAIRTLRSGDHPRRALGLVALLATQQPLRGHAANNYTSIGGDWKSRSTRGRLGGAGLHHTATIYGGTSIMEFNARARLVLVDDALALLPDGALSTVSLGVGQDGVFDPDDGEAALISDSGTVNVGQALKAGGRSVRPNGYIAVRGGRSVLDVTSGNFTTSGASVAAENISVIAR